MTTIDEKVFIEAPVAQVFSFVTDPENWPRFVEPLAEIVDLSSPQMEPGTTFSWEYRSERGLFRGMGHVNQNVLNAKFSMTMEGGLAITEAYTFTPTGEGTELSVHLVMNDGGDAGEEVQPDGEARRILEKIKHLCEVH